MNSTICAISTPAGTGGIAVARISGSRALEIVQSIWKGRNLTQARANTVSVGIVSDPRSGQDLDQAVAVVFRSPRSFTGEDVVELSVHGSPWIQRQLINLLIRQGARLAEPGEFSRRAFTAGKMDLAEVEGVADMIAASSAAAHRVALSHMKGDYSRRLGQLRDALVELCSLVELELDFSEEDVEFADRTRLVALAREIHSTVNRMADSFGSGNAIKNGINVVIAGPTNAGKSTLLNRLVGDDKAIVSPIHGTTRDVIEETAEISGHLFRFIDTAGLRETSDPIESIGIDRSYKAISKADIILWIIDPQAPVTEHPDMPEGIRVVNVVTKADLRLPRPAANGTTIEISAADGTGIDALTALLTEIATADTTPADMTVTNARHYQALCNASDSIARAIEALTANLPGDLVAQDLRETIHHLSTITGHITTPDLLSHIFSHFCIGK